MADEKIAKLVKRRSCMKSKLTVFGNYLHTLESCNELSSLQLLDLETRFNRFGSLYDDFDKLQCDIEMLSEEPDDEGEEREQFENQYYKLVAAARRLLGARPHQSSQLPDESVASCGDGRSGGFKSNCVRLPKINLPSFHGHYQNWLEFRDTYLSLIHLRSDIDNINKLHYLRASLKGSALLIIDNLDFKAENYEAAWNLLCSRYDNKRLLVNNHVHALFNVEHIKHESCSAIRHLIDVTNKNLRALSTLDQPTQYWDTLIIHMMAEKLDSVTHREWEEHRNSLNSPPSLEKFITFLSNKADLLETLQENKSKTKIHNKNSLDTIKNHYNQPTSTKYTQNTYLQYNTNKKHNNTYKKSLTCPMCNQNHFLFSCEAFRSLSIEERRQKAKDAKVCLNCLRPGHIETRCNLVPCKYCKKKHSTLLHMHEAETTVQPSLPVSNLDSFSSSTDVLDTTTPPIVLLSTALVRVVDSKGNVHTARVLLDNGSTANFVSEFLCGKLGLSRRATSTTVTGINNNTSHSSQSCSLTIISNYDEKYRLPVDCHILPHVTKVLPSSFINIDNITLPSGISLADPSFNTPSAVDILFWSVLCNNSIDLGKNQPKLYETKLGWLVSGYVARHKSHTSPLVCNFLSEKADPDLARFWELDSVATTHALSPEEQACEQSFIKNTFRKDDGRFVVVMPLKKDPSVLGDSYQKAKCRFLSLERKFQRDPVFKNRYMEFMHEYERLGHMTENMPSSFSRSDNVNFFLPHHGVVREESSTTKLRTVFDASATTSSGLSLNDIQMVGPTVQDDLYSILVRFRQHKYVVTGDVEKMYRAIELNPSQRHLQQIIFRFNPNEPLKTYTLNTVTYGTASAPYLATKCLVSLASNALDDDVKQSIQRDFYVDDYLGGSTSLNQTISMCKGVISVLKSAQFNLRKFKSNNQTILDHISPSSNNSNQILDLSDSTTVNTCKTLGLNWICDSDILSFSINIKHPAKTITKRHILSVISQIFDPLGLVSPCVIEAKILMQKLWINKYQWDDEVSKDILDSWIVFSDTLPCLNQLKIPRWVLSDNCERYEIHVFSDASQSAYGACLYIRSVQRSGSVNVTLVTSKCKVAPIKPMTIPRLELCGALLAARLCTKVLSSLTLQVDKCHFWCDSTIVLGWLTTSPLQLKHFVRNRVHEIQESTEGHLWSYVPSKDNPADLVSRGLKADSISNSSLWWSGPTFLLKDEVLWPKMPNQKEKHDLPELISCSVVCCSTNVDPICNLIKNTSNLIYLQKTIAYLQGFIYNFRNKSNKRTGHFSVTELKTSLYLLLHKAQLEMFPEEYAILKAKKSLPNKNRLISLSPYLDSNNLIRVGGRLDNSPYSFDTKHPILLCSKHHFTKLIFHYYHLKYLHAGPQLLLANIRQSYWPLGGRILAKNIVAKCVRCCRYKAQCAQPIMGQLPSSRSELLYPFLHCSVDYAGPVMIADRKGRGCKLIKSYLAIFVCNATKACHVELVTALSSEAYIAALNRFVSRRGKPQSITSDNGTNFVGTSSELSKVLARSDLEGQLALEGIEFKFIPAYSPHFNGLAEAAVRSIKHHLKRLLHTTHFTYEEMATCLAQIEAVLNSRPLTPLSSNPLDFSALTPSHFLIGRQLNALPHSQDSDVDIGKINRLERFKRIECIRRHFWDRFSLEYVALLQQKVKLHSTKTELKLGSLVLIKDRALPPSIWSLGRVTKVYPGSDGISRVAEVLTKRGTVRRAFNNICTLPES